jgi:hypothetical protein
LKAIIQVWGLNPNAIISKEALAKALRTIVDPQQHQIQVLNRALKQAIIKEFEND